jgi:hypothetical protein
MRTSRTMFVALVVASLGLIGIQAHAAPMHGAIFTTDEGCERTDANIYPERSYVHLNGGPDRPGSAGLPDGMYHIKVTEPNGKLLGATPAPVAIVNGFEFVSCYRLWDILLKASDGSTGYDLTSNNGGEYKAWASIDPAFPNPETKTDNFKVHGGEEVPL